MAARLPLASTAASFSELALTWLPSEILMLPPLQMASPSAELASTVPPPLMVRFLSVPIPLSLVALAVTAPLSSIVILPFA
mgnify:FL=1